MAGLLDNDFMRVLLSGSPYMQSREQQRREDVRSNEYRGLLSMYQDQAAGSEQVGPVNVPGALSKDWQPPSQFYAQAAAIPGYQQLAHGAQANLGAMQRDVAGRDWSLHNVPLADQQRMTQAGDQFNRSLTQNQAQYQTSLDEQKRQWGSISPVQQANIDSQAASQRTAQGQLGVAQGHLDWAMSPQNPVNVAASQRGPMGLSGQPLVDFYRGLQKADTTAATAMDVTNYMEQATTGGKIANMGHAQAVATAWQLIAPAYIAKLSQTGVINPGEMPRIQGIMGDPTKWWQLTEGERRKVGLINQMMQDDRSNEYQLAGMQAPPIQPGSSALARSATAISNQGEQPKGKLKHWSAPRPGGALSEGAGLVGSP